MVTGTMRIGWTRNFSITWRSNSGTYGGFFSEVPVLPARAVVPVNEMHHGVHVDNSGHRCDG
jgi:hypothetical protein